MGSPPLACSILACAVLLNLTIERIFILFHVSGIRKIACVDNPGVLILEGGVDELENLAANKGVVGINVDDNFVGFAVFFDPAIFVSKCPNIH